MFRYVALMWNSASPDECAVATESERRLRLQSSTWSVEFEAGGFKVLVADASRHLGAHRLRGNAGVVLGEIFARMTDIGSDRTVPQAVFDEKASAEVRDSQGRVLTSKYWGNYVALLVDACGTCVVNDPTGTLSCYFGLRRGIRVLFSCLADCLDLGWEPFKINWSFVRSRVVNGIYDVETNPLQELSCVHPGECVKFDGTGRVGGRCFYWHPQALRATVRSCVHSLAGQHSSVLQQTSGGLDSSIVLGCLADAENRPNVTCYTEFVPGAPCDERRWARYATAGRGYRHVDVCCDPSRMVFRDMPVLALSVEPPSYLSQWLKGPAERILASEYGASATFTGEGGDSVFCATSYVLAVDHSWRRHGFGARTLSTAVSVAARRDKTVWNVLGKALSRRLFGTHMREHRRRMSRGVQLVAADVRESVARNDHFPNPWFSAMDRVPLESIWRLGTLAYAQCFYDLTTSQQSDAPYTVSPLCAQPVVEICRRIPVDIHFDGGRLRGLARRAFRREVPAPILRRQWKDRPLSQPAALIERNLEFVREALLDGELTKQGILDRAALEAALQGGPSKTQFLCSEILNHLDLELWIRDRS
jgi:asparagine synthase (glutamine-hydrolysing)